MLICCIPHAGGSTLQYLQWKKYLDCDIKFVPLDYPGHITRQNDELASDFLTVLDDLYYNLNEELDQSKDEEYVIFGHSLGAVYAYELYEQQKVNQRKLPKHLFLSGRWAPYLLKKGDNEINDFESFKKYMSTEGNLQELSNVKNGLGEYFYSLIYNDIRLLDTYPDSRKKHDINIDATVMWGTKDLSMSYKDMLSWRDVAKGTMQFCCVDGGHLFPIENVNRTVEIINSVIKNM